MNDPDDALTSSKFTIHDCNSGVEDNVDMEEGSGGEEEKSLDDDNNKLDVLAEIPPDVNLETEDSPEDSNMDQASQVLLTETEVPKNLVEENIPNFVDVNQLPNVEEDEELMLNTVNTNQLPDTQAIQDSLARNQEANRAQENATSVTETEAEAANQLARLVVDEPIKSSRLNADELNSRLRGLKGTERQNSIQSIVEEMEKSDDLSLKEICVLRDFKIRNNIVPFNFFY